MRQLCHSLIRDTSGSSGLSLQWSLLIKKLITAFVVIVTLVVISTLISLTQMQNMQQAVLRKIEQQMQNWLSQVIEPEIAQMRAAAGEQSNISEVLDSIRSGKGKVLMDSIRQELSRFIETERGLLAERTASESSARTMAFANCCWVG